MGLRRLTERLRHGRRDPRELGRRGEELAARELRRRGYKILERNYRCKLGEIDLVAEHAGETVFLEVKTRSSPEFGDPQDAVTAAKSRRLVSLGETYLAEKGLRNVPWRIDVVSVRIGDEGRPVIELIENAVHG